MLLLFSSVAVCSLILLCVITSGIFTNAISKSISDDNQRILELTQKIVDDVFSETVNNITQLATDSTIQRYLHEDAIQDYTGFIDIKDRVVQMSNACSFVDSIYVVFPKLNFTITSYGYFFNFSTFHDRGFLSAVDMLEGEALMVWMGERAIAHARYDDNTVRVLTCVSRLPFDFSRADSCGYVVFNIRADYIRNFLSQNVNELANVIIWNNSGEAICSSFDVDDTVDWQEQGYAQIDFTMPSQRVKIGGRSVLVSQAVSSVVPEWTLVAYTDIMFLNNAVCSVLLSAIVVGVVLILVTLVAMFFSSNIIYTPIAKLASVSSGIREDIHDAVERYADLNNIYTNINTVLSENAMIKQTMEKNRSTLVDRFLVSLLLGYVSANEDTREYMRFLNLNPSEHLRYVVGLVRMETAEAKNASAEMDALRRILIADSANKHAWSSKYSCHVVEMASGTLAILLGLPKGEATERQSFDFFNDIYSLIREQLDFNTTICISETVDDLFDTPRLFRQVDGMLKHASAYNRHELMMYANFPAPHDVAVDLPSYVKRLVAAIHAGRGDDIVQILHELHKSAETVMLNRERVESIIASLYSIIMITVFNDDGETSTDAADLNLHAQPSIDALFDVVGERFRALARQNAQNEENQLHDTANSIVAYLQENYNRDIGLNDVSEAFMYTATYINRVLKFSTSKTFYELLTDIRIAKAKELLNTTTLSITEISEQVGYSNVQSFIRMFKRKIGMPPNQYRQTHS